MTGQELEQIRGIVDEALAPLRAARAATDTKLDRVLDRADDILIGVAGLRTDAENREAIRNLRQRIEALEALAARART